MEIGVTQEVFNLHEIKIQDKMQKVALPLEEPSMSDHSFQHGIEEGKRKPEIEIKEKTNKEEATEKITNWRLRIISERSNLKQIEEGLFNNDLVKAFQGQYEPDTFDGAKYPSLHLMVKFSKQMRKSGVLKIIKKLVEDPADIKKIILVSLGTQKKIELSKQYLTNSANRLKDTECVSKGEGFVNTKNALKAELQEKAKSLILEKGPEEAEEECAAQGLPQKLFEKAKKEIEWAEAMRERREMRHAAEKYVELFYPWQKFLLEQIEKVADDRTIWLVLDKNGANGKSQFQRTLVDKYPSKVLIIPDNNKRDILNLAAKHKKYNFVFMNVARQTKKIDLAAIENIKDGNVSSGKYQGKIIRTKPPHVVLFSNKPLCWEDLTEDRWKIIHITAGPKMAWKNDVFEVLTLSEYLFSTAQKEPGRL
jgi:hypothetical protein